MKRYRLTTCALSLLTLLAVAHAARDASGASPRRTSAGTQRRPSNAVRPQLRCSPGRLRRGDTLTLSMPAGHGGYLAVVNPRGKYFFITSGDAAAVASEKGAGANPSLTADAFGRMRQLRLGTAATKAVDYESPTGERRAESVFRETGWYKVLVSDRSFEREEPSAEGQCRIYYSDQRSKGR
ncbi:MAG TPA: hypothetical protein VM936_18505 [Pyrinomonadaceae bacterium]|jgi:hypothetical protein|nr:hypothetical protein [Pyrinomonadaceae bacterium]